MLNRIFYFVLGILFFYGCHSPEKDETVLSFEVDLGDVNSEYFNQYYRLSETIPLETTDSSVIGSLGKVIVADSFLFVMDWKKTGIWIFNRQGKFLRKIYKPGRGPQEYVRMGDFMVNRGSRQIILYDKIGKINYYDWAGNFLYSCDSVKYCENIENLPDGGWLSNHGFMHNVFLRDTAFVIIALDAGRKGVAGLSPLPPLNYAIPMVVTSGLFQDEDRFYAIPLTHNTIYEYDWKNKTFIPLYKFNVADNVLPEASKLTDQDFLDGFFKNYYMMFGEWMGKKTILLTTCLMQTGKFYLLLADKEKQKVYPMPYSLKDNVNELSLSRDFQQTGFEGKLVFSASALSVTSEEYESNASVGYQLSRQLQDDDNPVLFLYEEK